jgi:hypothetical protein
MTERDWKIALDVFRSCLPRRGEKGRNDRLFLEALHYFAVHNVSWRALPERFGNWNSVWKILLDLGPNVDPRVAIGDKGYDSKANRDDTGA